MTSSADQMNTMQVRVRLAPINSIVGILQTLREINPDLTLQTAVTFCLIAEHPGITQAEIVKLGNMGAAAVNRHVNILGRYNPRLRIGYELVSADVDANDHRRKLLHLTSTGHVLINRMIHSAGRV